MRPLHFLLATFAALLSTAAMAQETTTPNTAEIPAEELLALDDSQSVESAVTPEEQVSIPLLDSLIYDWGRRLSEHNSEKLLNALVAIDTVDLPASQIPDSVYIARLEAIGSAIPLSYNNVVRNYIISYTTRNKGVMSRVLGRSQYYFPIFEAELDAQGMPLELRMLPVIESSLVPTARSPKGASGLWQFMYGTSKGYGLEVSSFIDQRFDPILSTRAACKFLKHLYNIYGDWNLALAAYNCGPGNVNKALRKTDGKGGFWDIYPYLPKETRGYLPAFIAATYAYHYHDQHDITPAESLVPLATDTVRIHRIMHLEQISSTIGTPIEVLKALNPQFKQQIVPAVRGRSYDLVLPLSEMGKFLDNEATIMGKDTIYLAEYMSPRKNGEMPTFVIDSKIHKVKSGENLSAIARKYGVTVKQICKWNNIKDPSKIRVGQKLEIYLK
ncbi:MAG: transglycosylase SLT domain-containing protein [Tidjanibacter sp.]|nr:transglycosylase SLT domain-containing protein [Tidjanibacter sp.]